MTRENMQNRKYRVWIHSLKRMVYVAEKINDTWMCLSEKGFDVVDNIFGSNNVIASSDDDDVLMQCTGEFDINDEPIFEGDIVKVAYGTGNVIFRSGCYWIEWINEVDAEAELLAYELIAVRRLVPRKDLEIIGNIFENPELT